MYGVAVTSADARFLSGTEYATDGAVQGIAFIHSSPSKQARDIVVVMKIRVLSYMLPTVAVIYQTFLINQVSK